ncbi:hypothetical protein HK414_02175 [Ramlibacter terrae]|uniref:Uncharacterized protein n=1 Tax=Ramlibacter terrae TaxID=2732511 RepID=A0ABX6P162_9BURK|nr:hypothetical protein HK414_02175 [Ramlibacter terrae]
MIWSSGETAPVLQGAEMIQLATDPKASRLNWRPAGAEAKPNGLAQRRNGHAWPFISRHDERPAAQQQGQRTPNTSSGS